MTKFIVAGALALGLALPARADTVVQTTPAPAQTVAVQADHKSPVGTILVDGLGGALVGGAIGGGVAVYNRYGTNGGNGDWGNWQRDLFVGAGIGLGVGLIVGVVDYATSGPSATTTSTSAPAATTITTEVHDVGFSPAFAGHGFRF